DVPRGGRRGRRGANPDRDLRRCGLQGPAAGPPHLAGGRGGEVGGPGLCRGGPAGPTGVAAILTLAGGPRMSDKAQELQAVAGKLGIGGYHRHVFLCTGPTCCTPETGTAAWEALKKALKDR